MKYFCFTKDMDEQSCKALSEISSDFVFIEGIEKLLSVIRRKDEVWFFGIEDLNLMNNDGNYMNEVYQAVIDKGANVRFLYNQELNQTEGNRCYCGFCSGLNHFDHNVYYYLKGVEQKRAYIRIKKRNTTAEKGTHYGRPTIGMKDTEQSKRAKEVILKYSKDFGGDLSDIECIKLADVSRTGYYKYKKELIKKYYRTNNPE